MRKMYLLSVLAVVTSASFIACNNGDSNKSNVPVVQQQNNNTTTQNEQSNNTPAQKEQNDNKEVASFTPEFKILNKVNGADLKKTLKTMGDDGFLLSDITFHGIDGYTLALSKKFKDNKFIYRDSLEISDFALNTDKTADFIQEMVESGFMIDKVTSVSLYGNYVIGHKVPIAKTEKMPEIKFSLVDKNGLASELKNFGNDGYIPAAISFSQKGFLIYATKTDEFIDTKLIKLASKEVFDNDKVLSANDDLNKLSQEGYKLITTFQDETIGSNDIYIVVSRSKNTEAKKMNGRFIVTFNKEKITDDLNDLLKSGNRVRMIDSGTFFVIATQSDN